MAVQYDSTVGAANTSTNQPSDASVVLVKVTEPGEGYERGSLNSVQARSSGKALAVTTDCNSRYVYADPYKGAMIAVAEAARNIVCSGGLPLGVTNCLNFGNPYDPGVYYQFVNAIRGMGDACRRFDTPVTGGNVSFYNQNPDGAVYPTPTIGMVGLLENVKDKMTLNFKEEGDLIFLLGIPTDDIGSSEYLHKIQKVEFSPAPHFDVEEEVRLQEKVAELIAGKLIRSAHDVSEGGLFITLAESSFPGEFGFDVSASDAGIRKDAYWFGESQSRVVVSVAADAVDAFKKAVGKFPVAQLGVVTNGEFKVDGKDWGTVVEWKDRYDRSLENYMNKLVELN
ncbi:AIR synthase related protein [Puia sp. P3]|uniref:AIR synthase related protein n=1 Tax=Puia sp. P3 TaxID=3423952 RepID=UPI003D6747FC